MGRHSHPTQATTLPKPHIIASGIAAIALTIGASGFAFNNDGTIQEITAHANNDSPEIKEPIPNIENPDDNKYSDDQVVTSVVDFYNNVCGPLNTLTTVAFTMSETVEESVGKEGQDLATFWADSLHNKANTLNESADTLRNNSDNPNANAEAINTTANKASEVADAFHGYADTMTDTNVGEVAGQARTVAANQGNELATLVQDLVNSAPFPTTATAETVYSLESCRGVFATGPQLAEGETVDAALDFHNKLEQGKKEVEDTRPLLDEVEVSDDVEATANAIADVWKKRAEAAKAAENRMNEWVFPEVLSPAELAALEGYADAKNDAAYTWFHVAKSAREQEERIRNSADTDALEENLTIASDETWKQDVAEEKMWVRVNRNAAGGRG